MYLSLIELGLGFLQQFLASLKAAKAPAEVIQALQAALDSMIAHKNDLITRANLDSLRG